MKVIFCYKKRLSVLISDRAAAYIQSCTPTGREEIILTREINESQVHSARSSSGKQQRICVCVCMQLARERERKILAER